MDPCCASATPAGGRCALVAFTVVLEVVLLMPFVDPLADSSTSIHFTQHGFIFAGGVLLGTAIRDVQRSVRR